jgi:two-component system NtrC family sensor kinase
MARAHRILMVEDSATQALRFRHALEEAGFTVECVANAEAALGSLNKSLPDLLITDYRMPGVLGDELCRKIRMNVSTRGIPILMLTGEREGEIERRVLESGADDYVSKSQDLEFLLLRVQALLRKSHVQHVVFGDAASFPAAELLIVEDSATYRQLISASLQREGYAITTAASGAEALQHLSLRHFDGVVLDLVLPDMSAEEICRRIVESRRTVDHAFVILALTSRATRESMTSVLAAGADDVVEKSRDMAVTKARLRALIRRKRLHEENSRIAAEFRRREMDVLRAHAEKEAAEARAAMAERLEQANRELETAYRELKEAQSQLVQAAKMASLGQLVAGIAHEINNPLAFVMSHHGTVEGLLNKLAADLEPRFSDDERGKWSKALQRLRDMRQGLERIEDLVLKLRTFSRLDEGERKHVKIEESIESALALLQHRMKGRITVKKNYGDVKIISCYPGPLNQVLMNLLSNAIDAIDGHGEIKITTGRRDSMFFVSVADTGKGIARADRERIFEPFYTTKPVGEGTGLGLSISYGIVRRHDGSIEVHSEEGKGTEMIVKIPLAPVEAESRAKDES